MIPSRIVLDRLPAFPIALMLLLLAFTGPVKRANAASPPPFVHPGIWHTESDLESVRRHVKAKDQPWFDAWQALENGGPDKNTKVHPSPVEENAYHIQDQGHAAYVLAIKWVASGDIGYAHAAEGIIDAWTSTVTSAGENTMRNGLGSSQMANAAEILAYGFQGEAKWAPENVARAKVWFKKVVYPPLEKGASANWGTSTMTGIMSMGIFSDDTEMFDYAIAAYKHGFVVNGSLKDGCAGMTQYIDVTGENAESGRDQPHSQGGVAHFVEIALAALNQGIDLVHYNDKYGVLNYEPAPGPRLFAGVEYMAKYNLGHDDVPYHPFFEYCNNVTKYPTGPSPQNRGHFSPMWEMTVYLMKRVNLDPVYSEQVVVQPGYRPEPSNGDHPGLGTLMYATEPRTKSVAATAKR